VAVFVAKLNAAGTALIYSTFLGGSDSEDFPGIDVDSTGSAYVAGRTTSVDFPVKNAAQMTPGGGPNDAFLAKLSPTGNALVYATYLGGSGIESAQVAVDKRNGEAYVTGRTSSADFPVRSPYQASFGGCSDAFVAKYDNAGVKQFATYLGGTGCDYGEGVALDGSSNIYLTGYASSNFPVTPGALQAGV
jgi:hypothetical protein